MSNSRTWLLVGLLGTFALPAMAQSFRVQCPTSTITHPAALHDNNSEPAYSGPTPLVSTNPGAPASGYLVPSGNVNGAIKCQQISGGDGYATMGDGTQTYMFSFGPLSGIANIASGLPGTVSRTYSTRLRSDDEPAAAAGDPATTVAVSARWVV